MYKNLFFLDFHRFPLEQYENCIKSGCNDQGIFRNIFKSHFGLGKPLESPILDLETEFRTFRHLYFFYFSSITSFFRPKFSNPYCRKGSYGPYGPFLFSAKIRRDLAKRYQNDNVGGKVHFSFYQEMNLFYGGKFLKRSLIRGPLEAYIFIF